jgi:NADPH:quinone reductase-like Zn-dependent oxidoreductase
MSTFKAFRVFNENDRISARVVDATLEELGPGEVVLRTAYSSVNYKDALAGTGSGGRIIRKYPLVGGIDAAGVVVSSTDARFKAGDEVICTSYDLGVAHDGGYGGCAACRPTGSCRCRRGSRCSKQWRWARPAIRPVSRWSCCN